MRVLILSATTGGGHMSAANALKEYIMLKSPDSVVEISDTIECISPFLNKAVTEGYVYMAMKTPKMYGTVYKAADKDTALNKTIEIATKQLRKRLFPLLYDFKPDIIVTTHPFATEIISTIKSKKEIMNIPVISIITDFAAHKTYISEYIDAYIVSSREMVTDVVERGVDRVKIYPYGIPIKQNFYKEIDKKSALESEGLSTELPTLLIMAGSFGVTDVLKIYHKIVKSPCDFQIVVITGKNEKLYDTFDRYLRKIVLNNTLIELENDVPRKITTLKKSRHEKPAKPTKLLYYTNEVEKYMHIADMIITKPGGLTVSEAVAAGLPMGIFKAIPGQEEQNADFLVSKNMAVRLEKNKTCTQTVTRLLKNPKELGEMKKSVKEFSKGNSAENIYLLMCKLIEEYSKKAE